MASRSSFLGHFLIIDIGHPMTDNIILTIKKSLKNILSLAASICDISRIPAFGYGVLAPSFQIISQWKILTGNFLIIDRNLEYLVNQTNIGAKVTIKDYKSFLENSIENIVHDFEYYLNDWKSKTEIKEKFNPLKYWPNQMQVTLITRKAGSLILEMLKIFQNYSSKLKKIEIVEICSTEDIEEIRIRTNFISYITIGENIYHLDGIFKRWISGEETEFEQLEILLNKESGLHLKCEVNDCLINPGITTLPQTFSLSAMSSTSITPKPVYSTVVNPSIHKMEVVKKIGINDLCPSTFFGFPKWIYSKRSCITNWNEFLYNDEVFQALCVQLCTEEIGLLTRLKLSSSFNNISPLYFIVSDGTKLLMMNMVPAELRIPQLPQRMIASYTISEIKQQAIDVVRSLLGQMEMDKMSPDSSTFGIYEYFIERLKSGLKKTGRKTLKSKFKCIAKNKSIRAQSLQHKDILPGEYIPKFLLKPTEKETQIPNTSATICKKCNMSPKKPHKSEPIHPALLSPEKIAKYRKYSSDHYELPEVMEPGMVEM